MPQVALVAPQLAAFAEVARQGHVTGAAEALGMPQSSVTRRVQALEDGLGRQLLARVGRGVELTSSGRALSDRLQGPLRALEEALAAVAQEADPEAGTVRFGFPLTMGPVTVPRLLARFREEAPRVRLVLRQAHASELLDGLDRGELDLAVVIPPGPAVPHAVLGVQEIIAMLPESHRLAGQASIPLEELRSEQFIANPTSYHLRQLTEEWCEEAGFVPAIALEITEFSTVHAFVSQGQGVALMPPSESPVPGIRQIPLEGASRHRVIGLVETPSGLTRPAARLRDHLLARFSEA